MSIGNFGKLRFLVLNKIIPTCLYEENIKFLVHVQTADRSWPAMNEFFFPLLTSYSTAPRVISSCNVKLELEKRKVVCGAEVIKGVGYLFLVVTEGGWRGIGDTVDVT